MRLAPAVYWMRRIQSKDLEKFSYLTSFDISCEKKNKCYLQMKITVDSQCTLLLHFLRFFLFQVNAVNSFIIINCGFWYSLIRSVLRTLSNMSYFTICRFLRKIVTAFSCLSLSQKAPSQMLDSFMNTLLYKDPSLFASQCLILAVCNRTLT